MRFFLGLLVGLVALGGYVGYERWRAASAPPCAGRCGAGTACNAEGRCQPTRSPRARSRRPRRRRPRHRRPGAGDDTPQLKQARAADLRPSSEGPGLGGVDRIDMTSDPSDAPELSNEQVDRRFRQLEPRLLACIDKAREGWRVEGKVSVGFRIERSGSVSKVRVGAPALMMRRGLYRCIAPLVRGLRFARSARALIMTYPYRLD